MISALDPGMRVRARREFALHYAEVLVMAEKAKQMGLDHGAAFEEQMKLARIQILSQALTKAVREQVAQIPDKDVEDFYRKNTARFEKAELDRIYIPKTQQSQSACDRLSDDEKSKCLQESEQAMKKEADSLRERAIAGEGFGALQEDAYRIAEINSAAPGTNMSVRRISLPPDHVSVMDLSPGEVSAVIEDSNGYFVYKVKSKAVIPVAEATNEIKEALRTQRIQDEMHSILSSATSTLDEHYFAR
ncbi:MAG: peptidyl-prolyl cis-trans isomerase [Terracidiphilus sp.]